jgi:hypothetical protein
MTVEARLSAMRLGARLANGFVLDMVKATGFGMDVQDTVLVAAISQANLGHISSDPGLQRRFAYLATPIDDSLRRPISISAIAGSLRMPFETARRRIMRLSEHHVVEVSARGVMASSAPLASTVYDATAQATYQLVRGLYGRLVATGLEPLTMSSSVGPPLADHPVRLVARLSIDYALRVVEPIAAHLGDLVAGMILMGVIHANTKHLPTDPAADAALDLGPEGFPADHLRRPVRTTELARSLGLPVETVRRKMSQMVAHGRCARSAKGYIVPGRVLASEPIWTIMQDNRAQLLRLFTTLGEYGVLTLWRADVEGLRGAA